MTSPQTAEYLDRGHYEALVIGSGFGGAVAACRLAQAGIDVAIIERGRSWQPGDFPRDLSRLDDGWLWMCDHGRYDALALNDILAVRAAGPSLHEDHRSIGSGDLRRAPIGVSRRRRLTSSAGLSPSAVNTPIL